MIIQTSNPNHPIFSFVVRNDVVGFIQSEITDRKQHAYPPFSRLIAITIKHTDKKVCVESADAFAAAAKKVLKGVKVMGPGEPMISKIRNEYLMSILLKIPRDMGKLSEIKSQLQAIDDKIHQEKIYRSVKIVFDVDPN
ncbi:MAG TPA: hypothetical protein PLA68_17030 [Panacibacter sp.]|nr:hypothetical protein [Panacibacter sp.]